MNNDDKFKVLEITNSWIQNSDSKASTLLGFYGVILTIVFSTDGIDAILSQVKNFLDPLSLCGCIFLVLWLGSAVLFALGLYFLIQVLVPRINLNNPSIMFFGKVKLFQNSNVYIEKVKQTSAYDFSDDLLHQIYATSNICAQKFKCQKRGLVFSVIGLFLFFAFFLVALIVN